jgi:LemA protein
MAKGLIAVIVIVVLLLVAGGMYVSAKNQMVAKNESIDGQWRQIDVQLTRRADLIPNLVETVRGFAKQELAVFGEIARARAALAGARTPQERIAANNQLDSALSRLLVVVENYPQLRSNENFLRLQDSIEGTENRIAVERRRYNEIVQDYNTFITQFPNSLFAGIAGFQRRDEYFAASESDRTAPKVNFGDLGTPQPQQQPRRPESSKAKRLRLSAAACQKHWKLFATRRGNPILLRQPELPQDERVVVGHFPQVVITAGGPAVPRRHVGLQQ